MRIVVLNYRDPFHAAAGGSEGYMRRVAESWAAAGHDVTLFVPASGGAKRTDLVNGVRYERRGGMHTVFPAARRYLRRHRQSIDLVLEGVNARPFYASRIVGRSKVITIIHQTFHETWNREFHFPINVIGRYVLEPHWLRRMTRERVVTVSESSSEDLARYGVHAIGIVPPACDVPDGVREVRQRTSVACRRPRLVFVGRLVRAKRPFDAIAAFQMIRRVYPAATLDVVGRGYLLEELRNLDVPGLTVHGYLEEPAKHQLLSSSDLMLVTSTREGWGIVTIEAALHGVPSVAYDVPGLRNAVKDGETGVLTAPTPQALAEAALNLLGDGEGWNRCSQAAWADARRLTWEGCARQLMDLAPVEAGCDLQPGRVVAPVATSPTWTLDVVPERDLVGTVARTALALTAPAPDRRAPASWDLTSLLEVREVGEDADVANGGGGNGVHHLGGWQPQGAPPPGDAAEPGTGRTARKVDRRSRRSAAPPRPRGALATNALAAVVLMAVAATGLGQWLKGRSALPAVDVKTALIHAESARARGDMVGCIRGYGNVLSAEPDSVDALAGRAACESRLEDGAAAVRDLTRAVELSPSDPGLYVARGSAYAVLGNNSASAADWQRVVEMQQALPDQCATVVADLLGIHYVQVAQQTSAQALRRFPGDWRVLESEAEVLGDLGKAVEALNAYTSAFAAATGTDRAHVLYSRAIFRMGRNDLTEALADLDVGIAIDPGNYGLYEVRAQVHQAQGQLAAGEKDYTTALLDAAIFPNTAFTTIVLLRERGYLRLAEDDTRGAVADFETARSLVDPTDEVSADVIARDLAAAHEEDQLRSTSGPVDVP